MSLEYIPNINKYGEWKNSSRAYAYRSWQAMRSRCYRANDKCFHLYGGRGIKVCDRWLNDYDSFFEDMGDRDKSLSLDRIDSNGHYTPDNCRWVNMRTQQQNRRNNHIITFDGKSLPASEWGRVIGIRPGLILQRLERGCSIEQAFSVDNLNAMKHGTNNMYSKYHCRCVECKSYNAGKSKKARLKLKLKKTGVINDNRNTDGRLQMV